MALPTYTEILKLGKEKVEELKVPMRVKEMRKKAELEMCQLETMLMDAEAKVTDLCSQYPINFSAVIDASDQRELIGRRIKQYADIIEQMFSPAE